MDVSWTPLAPRPVPDLRPSADLAASARAEEPAPGLPPSAAGVPPASAAQRALVARGLLDPRAVSPTGAADPAGEARPDDPQRPPPRLLKPWGVPMLPTEEKRAGEDPEPSAEGVQTDEASAAPAGAVPPHPDEPPRGASTVRRPPAVQEPQGKEPGPSVETASDLARRPTPVPPRFASSA
jgi:hypothetical protein